VKSADIVLLIDSDVQAVYYKSSKRFILISLFGLIRLVVYFDKIEISCVETSIYLKERSISDENVNKHDRRTAKGQSFIGVAEFHMW